MDSTAIRIISYFDNIEEFLLGVLFFSLPFGWTFSIIPLVLYSTLLIINIFTKPSRPSKEKLFYFLPAILFFLWECISLLYTTDKKEGLSTLGTQAFLILASLTFLFNKIKPESISKAFYLFLLGCVSSLLLLYGIAIYNSSSIIGDAFVFRPYFDELGPTILDSDTSGHFFAGQQFSQFIHPAYLALQLGIGMSIILQGLKLESQLLIRKRLWLGIFTFFGVSIIAMSLNSSSLMIIVFSILVLAYLSVKSLLYGELSRGIYSSILVFLLFFLLNPQVNTLMTQQLNTPSIITKKHVTKVSTNILKDNWLWGVGIGDIDMEMEASYMHHNHSKLVERCPNPHNQFLTTWLHGGLPALALLIWFFVNFSLRAYKKKALLLHAISILFVLSFWFESMLLRYWGIITFTIFYGALYFYTQKPLKDQNSLKQ